ncbi:MAG: flagellar basal body rod protein FlgB [Lachnospiraceae bacterium]|nr:flagellar basal body rod protein FlgB [Lachnospiraceae bacterium]
MVRTGAFDYINILEKGLDASWTRNSVISNNIANVDTPGYKRKDVQFEDYLMAEVGYTDNLDREVARADLDDLFATTYTEYEDVSYRIDGNNVDIDTESAELAKNQIKYYTMLDSVSQEFNRLKSVTKMPG